MRVNELKYNLNRHIQKHCFLLHLECKIAYIYVFCLPVQSGTKTELTITLFQL